MNRAQRATLVIVLAIDALLILFPPFENSKGYRYGHDWLGYGFFNDGAQVALGALTLEIVIVGLVGFTAFVLAGDMSDDRARPDSAATDFRVTLSRQWATPGSALRLIVLGPLYVVGAAIVGLALAAVVYVAWAAVAYRPG